jgi:hypothetical protein
MQIFLKCNMQNLVKSSEKGVCLGECSQVRSEKSRKSIKGERRVEEEMHIVEGRKEMGLGG